MIPAFMADDLPNTAPDLGSLAIGSEILVVEPSYHRRRVDSPESTRAVITKKARIWITAVVPASGPEIDAWPRSWRFRLDNQTDGSESHYAARFYTPDQYRFRQASISAREYLANQGIRIDWDSPWKDESRTIELARTIWTRVTLTKVDSSQSGSDQ